MKRVLFGLALALIVSVGHAATLTINGQVYYDVESIVITTSPIVTEPTTPVTPTPQPPTPTPTPPVASTCVQSSTQLCGTINWAAQGGRITSYLTGNDQVQSWKFTTTSNPSYTGDINIAEMTGWEPLTRRMWISHKPSGPTIGRTRCETQGNSARKIGWAQSANFLRCQLDTNTTYYLNVQNLHGCPADSKCGYYRNTGTNGRP